MMAFGRSLLVGVMAWLIVIACSNQTSSNEYGPLVERWETSNSKVTIRVSVYQKNRLPSSFLLCI